MPNPLLYPVRDACVVVGISRSGIYRLLNDGTLSAKKIGRRTLVTAESIRLYIDSCPDAEVKLGRHRAKAAADAA